MSRTDDILAAIDSAVADREVSDDAVRMPPPGASRPETASGYTARSGGPEWAYSWDDAGFALQVLRYGHLWGAVLPQDEYVVSDGEYTTVMPAPPAEGVWFATAGPPGTAPTWRPVRWREPRRIEVTTAHARESVADVAGIRAFIGAFDPPLSLMEWQEALLDQVFDIAPRTPPPVPVVSASWVGRRHAVRSEYARRRRNRGRRR